MCGPIAFMLPLDRSRPTKKLLQLSLYHLGRLFSYALLGLVFGLVGKSLHLFGFQQKLSIAIGILMIVLVVLPSKYFSTVSLRGPIYKVMGRIKSKLANELKKKSPDTFLTIGLLNGFLPCGLVYMALFAAIAIGSPIQSSLYMVLFGIGTVPLMTTAVYAFNSFGNGIKTKVRKLVPLLVALVGFLFIIRGMGLGIPYISPKPVVQEVVSSDFECH
ncbi:sulfite exporter TauE/SafE family protein [Croceivirga thetidis]